MSEKNDDRKARNSAGERKIDVVKFCAFWGIFLSAVMFLVIGIFELLNKTSTVVTILDIVAKLALLVGVSFPAYSYVRGKGKVWKIIFWVVLAVYVLGCVFSII